MYQSRSWLRSRLPGPFSIFTRTVRYRPVVLPLAAALGLLGGVIAVQFPPAAAASSAYAVTEVPLFQGAFPVAADPATNTIYAGVSDGVAVINAATNTFTTLIGTHFPVYAIAVDPTSDTVYAISDPDTGAADVIDGATNTVTATISVPAVFANNASANPGTSMAYVTDGHGVVDVLNSQTDTTTTINLRAVQEPNPSPTGIAVDTANHTIYVADSHNNMVVEIDSTTNTVTGRIALASGSAPAGVAVDPAAGKVYVADQGTGAVSVIDAATDSVSTLASGMTQPSALALDSSSATLYATSTSGSADGLGTTYPIDTSTGTIAAPVARGGAYAAMAPGSAGSGSVYVGGSPIALVDDVTVITPSTTTTMSPVIVNDLPTYPTFTVGQAVQDQLAANAIPAATFSATGLPAGVTLSPSGLLAGTPATGSGGLYYPVITAANGIAPPATSGYIALSVDEAPAITSADQAIFDVGVTGNFIMSTRGYPLPAISESGALPAGVTFSAGGVLSGTPAAGTAGRYPILVTATNQLGTATQAFTLTVAGKSLFVPAGPVRMLDTRNGTGGHTGQVGPGQSISLQVTGRDGVPTTGVTAVALNVTAVSPTASSYVTVYPDGSSRPTASNLNFTAGETIPNLVIVPVGADGQVDFYNHTGSVNLVADLAGYYASGAGSSFVPIGPSRVLDTRSNLGSFGPVDPGGTVNLQVTGRDGVPTTGVTAVVLNVTAVNSTASSYVTVYPDGSTRPTASNLNFTAGETIPNLVIVPVGADGQVDLYNNTGIVNLVADLAGYYTTSGAGSVFAPAGPSRVLDTRNGTGGFSTPVGPGRTISLQLTGSSGIPTGVTAVVLNVTATGPTASSYVTVYPDGQPQPTASNLNFTAGETIPNLVIVPVVDGKIDFYNNTGSVNLVADLAGYYTSF